MRRQPRVEVPGAIYHLMSPGDRREAIFLNDVHRQDLPQDSRRSLPKNRLATPRLLPDAQSFSPGGGDAGTEPVRKRGQSLVL
jgi:hypothetical protein